WWQLAYTRGGKAFITANELHVPAGRMVTVDWHGRALAAWSAHDFVPIAGGRSFFIARDSGVDDVFLVRLWPRPTRRHLRIVADAPASFERWFVNEMQPA